MRTIIAVAGSIAAGKSTLARAIAEAIDGTGVGFGDYIRIVAEERGEPMSREHLQVLGEQLIAELGADEFSRSAIADAPRSGTLVVDGVRHLAISDALSRLADRYLLVFVTVDDSLRRQRLDEREGRPMDLSEVDLHSTERDVPALRERADLVVDGADQAAPGAVAELLARTL